MMGHPTFVHPATPFPVGVEYYRGGSPTPDMWDEDFARIRELGFSIVRSASYWNWMEPVRGEYHLDDYDLFFDTAHKHGLSVWLDIMLATHGACPEWLTRDHPDIRVINYRGRPHYSNSQPAYPQGGVIHCYDHPLWRELGGNLLRYVINRYKDHPATHIWGLWDGVAPSSQWVDQHDGHMCYCENSLHRWKKWLKAHFTLQEFNDQTLRRYGTWEDVEPPRSNNNVLEMLLFRQFHYENLADHLEWMITETRELDTIHETRTHGAWFPRPWDETCAQLADSWGMSMSSNNILTSNDPGPLIDRTFAFAWSRCLGPNGRWWNEEIYSGMAKGGVTWKKQTDPRELTTLLWLTLANGAAGAMFWQYRPDHVAFESPGYNLAALDGKTTPRLEAVSEAIGQIERLRLHLPLKVPKAEVALVVHQTSQELFGYNDEDDRFLADVRGTYRTLWKHGIPVDVVTPRKDWSGYKLIILPNVSLMTEGVRNRIESTLEASPGTRFVAEGSFGLYSDNGLSSYNPPEGFSQKLGVRIADFSRVTEQDIESNKTLLRTPYGDIEFVTETGYAVLEPLGATQAIASIEGQTVAIRTDDGRFTWYGLTFSAGFGDFGSPELILGILRENGIQSPVSVDGDLVVPLVRESAGGGNLIFVFNIEPRNANVFLTPQWKVIGAVDLLTGQSLQVDRNTIEVQIPQWQVAVISTTNVY